MRLPAGVDRRLAAPGVGLVDDVVMDERGDVDHFDQHGGQARPPPEGSPGHGRVHGGGKHDQQRPDALAARRKRILQHFGEQLALGGELPFDEFVERSELRFDGFTDYIECCHLTKKRDEPA